MHAAAVTLGALSTHGSAVRADSAWSGAPGVSTAARHERDRAQVATAACVCICSHTYACTYTHSYVGMCMPVCMNECLYVCVYVCMHVCGCMSEYVCMHACMCLCMYVCMHVCMNTHRQRWMDIHASIINAYHIPTASTVTHYKCGRGKAQRKPQSGRPLSPTYLPTYPPQRGPHLSALRPRPAPIAAAALDRRH